MDERILQTIDKLRDRFGPATINNYEYGGDREWSGLRTPDSPWYSPYSQHTFGRAVDILFKETETWKVRQHLRELEEDIDNHSYFRTYSEKLLYITAVEEDVSWLHIDCRNCERIKWFKP